MAVVSERDLKNISVHIRERTQEIIFNRYVMYFVHYTLFPIIYAQNQNTGIRLVMF